MPVVKHLAAWDLFFQQRLLAFDLLRQFQHAHAGVVVVHEVALRRQGEQMLIGNSRALLRGIPNQFPLIGRRQRNARRLLEPLQAIARHPFPITQRRDDRRHARIRF